MKIYSASSLSFNVENIHLHIESFEELFKADISSVREKDGFIGMRRVFHSLMWLSKIFQYQDDSWYNRLAAVALHCKIEEFKKNFFVGEWKRFYVDYQSDIDQSMLDDYRKSQSADCFVYNLAPSRCCDDDWVGQCISIYLKCLEFDVFRALSIDGNHKKGIDVFSWFSVRMLTVTAESATSNFVEMYNEEYLMSLFPMINSRLVQKDLKMTRTTFYDLMKRTVENKEKELFLKLSTLSYMGVIAEYVEGILSDPELRDKHSLRYPYTLSSSEYSEKEMLDVFNKERRKVQ